MWICRSCGSAVLDTKFSYWEVLKTAFALPKSSPQIMRRLHPRMVALACKQQLRSVSTPFGVRRLSSDVPYWGRAFFHFDIGAHALPHPRKTSLGEDAHFYSRVEAKVQPYAPERAILGVADGVGGAADSAWYSSALMANCETISAANPDSCPREVLQMAWANARSEHALDGRSTACLVTLDGGESDPDSHSTWHSTLRRNPLSAPTLRAANLGDSGFMVLRRRKGGRLGIAFKSKPQTWSFNAPYQLGLHDGEELNTPADAEILECDLQLGDTIVVATDGLFDLLYPLEILELVTDGKRRYGDPRIDDYPAHIAKTLVETAIELSKSSSRLSPKVEALANEGYVARTREAQDDVTVVVAEVRGFAARQLRNVYDYGHRRGTAATAEDQDRAFGQRLISVADGYASDAERLRAKRERGEA